MSRLRSIKRITAAIVIVLALGAALFMHLSRGGSGEDSAPAAVTTNALVKGGTLMVPVQGVAPSALNDTFSQARAAGLRVHDAIDIPAPRGTPVIAAAPGTIEKLFTSEAGGLTVYVRSDDGLWNHYYAHLDGYAPGLAEGQRVSAGQAIGNVGSTGNADPSAPHLHFAIHAMRAGDAWYEGVAVNPYPLLAASEPAR